jgi:hypothetical protein
MSQNPSPAKGSAGAAFFERNAAAVAAALAQTGVICKWCALVLFPATAVELCARRERGYV